MPTRISNSSIQLFKSCRRAYELKYIEGVLPAESPDSLVRGRGYHGKVEAILNGEPWEFDDPKTDAMAMAFERYILPQIHGIKGVEEWFERTLENGNTLVGRCDGILEDGTIVEHKTTSAALDDAYIAGLQNDEQILTYMWAYKTNRILYTVCKTPTIRQKQNESEDEFRERCLRWFADDTATKIGTVEIYRSDDELAEFEHDLQRIAVEMEGCKFFYRTPSHCTKWGRMCEYAPICRNYDPTVEYIGFTRKKDEKA